MAKFIQVKQGELKALRLKQYNKQKGICPILNKEIPFCDSAFDHKHGKKAERVGENGASLLRGVLSKIGNSWEGKVLHSFKRMGLHKHIDFVSALRNLADYLEHPLIEQIYIHPTEIEKPKKLQKKCFNELSKKYSTKYPKRKPLVFPKRAYLTKHLRKLFKEFKLEIKYRK